MPPSVNHFAEMICRLTVQLPPCVDVATSRQRPRKELNQAAGKRHFLRQLAGDCIAERPFKPNPQANWTARGHRLPHAAEIQNMLPAMDTDRSTLRDTAYAILWEPRLPVSAYRPFLPRVQFEKSWKSRACSTLSALSLSTW